MGFHWTPCNPIAGILGPIAALIVCAMVAPKLPAIIRDVMHGLEWCCAFFAAGMVVMVIVYKLLDHFLAPRHIIWIQGRHDYIGYLEAPDGQSSSERIINGVGHDAIRGPNSVPVLLGSAYERKDTRQLVLSKRRNSR